jgi:hypothetical protein
MSGIIHLISEDRTDALVVQAILNKKRYKVRVKMHPTSRGGISRLAQELEALIKECIDQRTRNDCIAVLHDADKHTLSNHPDHDSIKRICQRYSTHVVEIVAHDELESWILADSGLYKWLRRGTPGNWDERRKPSESLEGLLKNNHKSPYRGRGREEVLSHLAGDGDKCSPSMEKAVKHLENAPCVKS